MTLLCVDMKVVIRSATTITEEEKARDSAYVDFLEQPSTTRKVSIVRQMENKAGTIFTIDSIVERDLKPYYNLRGSYYIWPRCMLVPVNLDLEHGENPHEAKQEHHKQEQSPYAAALIALKSDGASSVATNLGDDIDELLAMTVTLRVESSGVSKMACLERALSALSAKIAVAQSLLADKATSTNKTATDDVASTKNESPKSN